MATERMGDNLPVPTRKEASEVASEADAFRPMMRLRAFLSNMKSTKNLTNRELWTINYLYKIDRALLKEIQAEKWDRRILYVGSTLRWIAGLGILLYILDRSFDLAAIDKLTLELVPILTSATILTSILIWGTVKSGLAKAFEAAISLFNQKNTDKTTQNSEKQSDES